VIVGIALPRPSTTVALDADQDVGTGISHPMLPATSATPAAAGRRMGRASAVRRARTTPCFTCTSWARPALAVASWRRRTRLVRRGPGASAASSESIIGERLPNARAGIDTRVHSLLAARRHEVGVGSDVLLQLGSKRDLRRRTVKFGRRSRPRLSIRPGILPSDVVPRENPIRGILRVAASGADCGQNEHADGRSNNHHARLLSRRREHRAMVPQDGVILRTRAAVGAVASAGFVVSRDNYCPNGRSLMHGPPSTMHV